MNTTTSLTTFPVGTLVHRNSNKCGGEGFLPLVTIEPLLCCLCGRGIEAGRMVGGRINGMFHPDCLMIDPFAEVA